MPFPFDNDPEQPSGHGRSKKRLGDAIAERSFDLSLVSESGPVNAGITQIWEDKASKRQQASKHNASKAEDK